MADDIVREFDPNFGIPIGLKNAVMKTLVDGEEVAGSFDPLDEADTFELIDTDPGDGPDGLDFPIVDIPLPPDSITIVSQTVRQAADGTQVVDVVIEVADTDFTQYNIKVTAI